MDSDLEWREQESKNVIQLYDQYCTQFNPHAQTEAGRLLSHQLAHLSDEQLRDLKLFLAKDKEAEQEKIDKVYDAGDQPKDFLGLAIHDAVRPHPKPLIPDLSLVEDTHGRVHGVTIGSPACSTYLFRPTLP